MLESSQPENQPASPQRQYANGAVRVYGGQSPKTQIDINSGTVSVVRKIPTPGSLSPYLGIEITNGQSSKTVIRILPHYIGGIPAYTFVSTESQYLGIGFGRNLDLAVALALGVRDEKMVQDAGVQFVDAQVADRLKTEFYTL